MKAVECQQQTPTPPVRSTLAYLSSSIRSWLGRRDFSSSPAPFSPRPSAPTHSYPRSYTSTFSCGSVEEESEEQLLDDQEDREETKVEQCRGGGLDPPFTSLLSSRSLSGSAASQNPTVSGNVNTNIKCSEETTSAAASAVQWEYCGQSVPLILDMFLQQEALTLLRPASFSSSSSSSSSSSPHTHCLDCYPAHWQESLRHDSAHTCFSPDELDPWSATAAASHVCVQKCLLLMLLLLMLPVSIFMQSKKLIFASMSLTFSSQHVFPRRPYRRL
jgi:hypothetical protein